jgi:two-component system LytT family response regulator
VHVRAIIVDDEDLSRARLKKMLGKYRDELEIIADARNGEEAVEKSDALNPDVIFLDIQMPGLNGFEVVRRMKTKPYIVFVTAYDEYALKAFEENTVDYLLKPIEQERLDKTIQKLRRGFEGQKIGLDENIERFISRMTTGKPKRLQVKVGEKILLLDMAEIVYFEARDKYTFVHTTDHEHIVDYTLAELEAKLDNSDFVRIHRSAIINLEYLQELVKWFGGRYKVRLRDKNRTELVVSRGYVDNIHRL